MEGVVVSIIGVLPVHGEVELGEGYVGVDLLVLLHPLDHHLQQQKGSVQVLCQQVFPDYEPPTPSCVSIVSTSLDLPPPPNLLT